MRQGITATISPSSKIVSCWLAASEGSDHNIQNSHPSSFVARGDDMDFKATNSCELSPWNSTRDSERRQEEEEKEKEKEQHQHQQQQQQFG